MDEIWGHDRHKMRDPERRWLRRTYQEGRGFRFLVTRGGRPPQSPQRSSELAVVRRRARVVRIAHDSGIEAALALGACSRTSLWRWMRAYQRGGLAALVPEPRGPGVSLCTHPRRVEQEIQALRLVAEGRTGKEIASAMTGFSTGNRLDLISRGHVADPIRAKLCYDKLAAR